MANLFWNYRTLHGTLVVLVFDACSAILWHGLTQSAILGTIWINWSTLRFRLLRAGQAAEEHPEVDLASLDPCTKACVLCIGACFGVLNRRCCDSGEVAKLHLAWNAARFDQRPRRHEQLYGPEQLNSGRQSPPFYAWIRWLLSFRLLPYIIS